MGFEESVLGGDLHLDWKSDGKLDSIRDGARASKQLADTGEDSLIVRRQVREGGKGGDRLRADDVNKGLQILESD